MMMMMMMTKWFLAHFQGIAIINVKGENTINTYSTLSKRHNGHLCVFLLQELFEQIWSNMSTPGF